MTSKDEREWSTKMLAVIRLLRPHMRSRGHVTQCSSPPRIGDVRRWWHRIPGLDLNPRTLSHRAPVELWLDAVLKPLQNCEARYVPVRDRVYDARDGAVVCAGRTGRGDIRAWALLFAPSEWRRSGVDEPYLLLLTPIWPTTHLSDRDCADLFEGASEMPGWGVMKHDGGEPVRTAVVAIDAGKQNPGRRVRTYASDSAQWQVRWVDAQDVASCLGWPGLPAWPRATNTHEFCAAWAPGCDPLVVRVPGDVQHRWAAARWLLQAAALEPERAPDYAQLAYYTSSFDMLGYRLAGARGRTPAAEVVSAPLVRYDAHDATSDVFDVVRALATRTDVPPDVIDTVLDYFGDPQLRRPSRIARSALPYEWQRVIDLNLRMRPLAGPDRQVDDRTGQVRRLHAVLEHAGAQIEVVLGGLGPASVPAALSPTHLAVGAPITMDETLPVSSMREVLLVRGDGPDVTVLGRTVSDDIVPLPVSGLGLASRQSDLLVLQDALACVEQPIEQPRDLRSRLSLLSHPYLHLLDGVGVQESQVVMWDAFYDIVSSPVPDLSPSDWR